MATPKLDAIGAEAVEIAAQALADVTLPGQVGEHVRVEAGPDRLVNHVFECTMPGYRGWHWVATLARAPRAKTATVCETMLMPGEGALLAPEWEPWSKRLRPSDVGVDDELPFIAQDERLDQAFEQPAREENDEDAAATWEIGLGRKRVLNRIGRQMAATRWDEGEFGPRAISVRGREENAAGQCSACGFLLQIAGSLRQAFGVCSNEWSPADGRVVSLGYGCGAHSETDPEQGRDTPEEHVVLDEMKVDFIDRGEEEEPAQEAAQESEQEPERESSQEPAHESAQESVRAEGREGKDESPEKVEEAGDSADA
ncbi:DUF3027 domain-containing protein [Dermabacteraceae bacterium P13115]